MRKPRTSGQKIRHGLRSLGARFRRLLRWEFWPGFALYLPVYILLLVRGLGRRNLAFFTAVNPGMPRGGFVAYSKALVLERLGAPQVPRGRHLKGPVSLDTFREALEETGLDYPVIIKPDEGERGFAVTLARGEEEARQYLESLPLDLLLQEYDPGPEEYGIFYERHPREKTGRITSVVIKEALLVRGNGTDSLADLVWRHPRARLHYDRLAQWHRDLWWSIPEAEEEYRLTDIGNHSRGFTFRDGRHLIDSRLNHLFDSLSQGYPGFHFGRYDVRTPSWEALLQGQFSIVELNGSNSEPAHIYDPHFSLLRAWKDLTAQWLRMFTYAESLLVEGAEVPNQGELIRAIRAHLGRKKKLSPKRRAKK